MMVRRIETRPDKRLTIRASIRVRVLFISLPISLTSRSPPVPYPRALRLNLSLLTFQMPKRGAFIVFEGLDRSGKSSQAATLLKRLQDAQVPAKLLKFPG